jgi:DNA-binding response OmpR family regulator
VARNLEQPATPTDTRPPTVLLVDDSDDCRFIYTIALEHAGLRVLTAVDGREGVRVALENEPDAILMDIEMPELNGLQALRALRSEARMNRSPVLAVTARASVHQQAELLRAGFDEVLLKPIEPGRVVAAVQLILGRADRKDMPLD